MIDVEEFNKKRSQELKEIFNSDSKESRLKTLINYLSFLCTYYENGLIGYMVFPYYIVEIMTADSIDELVSNNKKLDEIFDLSASLEWENKDSPTNPINRLEPTYKLCQLIRNLEAF